jgi:Tfp pilus assembly protein PilN
MRPLALNFVGAPARGPWGVLTLLLGIAAASASGAAYWDQMKQRTLLESRVDQLSERLPVSRGTSRTAQKPDDKARALALVSERITVPWDRLFQDIESCDNPDVALLQLQPNIAQHQVTLMGEARDRQSLEAYMRRLEETASLEGVHLAQHNQAPESGPWAIRYAMTAKWVYEQP